MEASSTCERSVATSDQTTRPSGAAGRPPGPRSAARDARFSSASKPPHRHRDAALLRLQQPRPASASMRSSPRPRPRPRRISAAPGTCGRPARGELRVSRHARARPALASARVRSPRSARMLGVLGKHQERARRSRETRDCSWANSQAGDTAIVDRIVRALPRARASDIVAAGVSASFPADVSLPLKAIVRADDATTARRGIAPRMSIRAEWTRVIGCLSATRRY
jgi:hypothetical protein